MQQQEYISTTVKQISLHEEEEINENEVDAEKEENEDQKNWAQGVAGSDQLQ